MAPNPKPLPTLTSVNSPYFAGAAEGRLILQRCQSCKQWIFYPRVLCPYCLSRSLEWEEVDGTGELYSFAVVHRPQHEAFFEEVPIVLAAVKLDEGPIIISTLLDRAPADIQVGQRVVAVFDRANEEIGLVKFKVADS